MTPGLLSSWIPSVLGALAPEGAHGAVAHAADATHGAGHMAFGGPVEAGPLWVMMIPLLPLIGFVLCGLCAALRIKSKLPAFLTVGLIGAAFVLVLSLFVNNFMDPASSKVMVTHVYTWFDLHWPAISAQVGEQHFVASFAFYLDSLTILWMLFVTLLGSLIALYASEYMSHDLGAGYCRFFAAFNLFVFSMSCLVMADNLVLMFLGWEGVGLCSYLLIGYFYKKEAAVAAAKKAFIVNRIADLFLVLGLMGIYVAFGTVEYSKIFEMVANGVDGSGAPLAGSWVQWVIPLLLSIGAFGKSAQVFFYVWLPDAMEGPTPVSALIHAATMVTAGVFLIARMYPVYTIDVDARVLTMVAWAGAITAFWAATIGMAHFDIKRIMGYSTVSQLGFMFAGLGVMTSTGAAFHVVTHAFFKATLFLACGAVMHGFAGQLDLRKLSGVRSMKGWQIVGLAMLLGALNLAGFPLLAGYWSKDIILAEGFARMPLLGALLLLTAGLTAYYTFRAYFRVFEGPQHFEPGEDHHAHDDAHGDGHGHDHGHGADDNAHASHDHKPAHKADHASDHAHGADHFHPHAPGWAINTVLVLLMVGCLACIPLAFLGSGHGWVGDMVHHSTAAAMPQGNEHPHHTILGLDPHKAMYYISAVVGIIGILVAAFFHAPRGMVGLMLGNRTRADVAPRADALASRLGVLVTWARNKWYVDEFYDAIIRNPLKVISKIFHLIDQYIIDGLVNLVGMLPRSLGAILRPSQSGELHGYAAGMAGGIAVLIVLVLIVTTV